MIWSIRRRPTFEALRRPQRRVRSGPISVAFVSREALGSVALGDLGNYSISEFAFSIPRRVGKAVTRNTIRRRLRAEVARLQEGLAPGAYLVATAPAAATVGARELAAHLDRALAPFRERPPR